MIQPSWLRSPFLKLKEKPPCLRPGGSFYCEKTPAEPDGLNLKHDSRDRGGYLPAEDERSFPEDGCRTPGNPASSNGQPCPLPGHPARAAGNNLLIGPDPKSRSDDVGDSAVPMQGMHVGKA